MTTWWWCNNDVTVPCYCFFSCREPWSNAVALVWCSAPNHPGLPCLKSLHGWHLHIHQVSWQVKQAYLLPLTKLERYTGDGGLSPANSQCGHSQCIMCWHLITIVTFTNTVTSESFQAKTTAGCETRNTCSLDWSNALSVESNMWGRRRIPSSYLWMVTDWI